jgi:hypothetical protein
LTATPPPLEAWELTVLTAWAEALAEALAYAPERAHLLLAEARAGAPWRSRLGLPEPSPPLREAIETLSGEVRAATPTDAPATFDGLLTAVQKDRPGEPERDRLVRRVLRSMLEQRRTRLPPERGGW